MSRKIIFQSKNEAELFEYLKSNYKNNTLNFINLHDIYQFNNTAIFKKALLEDQNLNFIDGFIISVYLSLLNFKKVSRLRGPRFTKTFLSNANLSGSKKHFFIGLEDIDLERLQDKFPHLKKVSAYNPRYIKKIKFSKKEIEKIATLINKINPDFVWIGIGSPKQNILSSQLSKKTNTQYFINIGAALDFILDKKKEAPSFIRKIGLEWIYRLVTDFEHSKKKVWRSFVSLKNLIGKIELK